MTESPTTTGNDKDDEYTQDVAPSARTPLYAAFHSDRYNRQDLIREIQQESGFRLICYVSGSHCSIEHDDAMRFRDLLHRVANNQNIELLLHTAGGDIDAAEKLVLMIREKVGESSFRIVVPHLAKSAGTLMVLGADTVLMSDTSELGPIDPQVLIPHDNTGMMRIPAQSYLDAYDEHARYLETHPNDVATRIMFEKLDPSIRQVCLAAKQRSRSLAETLLRRGMFFNGPPNWTVTAGELIDTKRWRTHSQVISWRDAMDPPIALRVDYLDPQDPLWEKYWHLYCLQRLQINDNEKLFESDYVSLKTE